VRLWSFVGGTWFVPPLDVTYNALAANVQPPIIVPPTGSYKKKVKVNMATATPGAAIYYTLDNSTPTLGSATTFLFTTPFTLTTTTTVRAKAVKTGVPDSPVTAVGYTIKKK
jgi:hypothetical protein